MRLSELSGKEVINLADGSRLGVLTECELVLDGKTGTITGIILPRRRSFFDFRSEAQPAVIPWQAVKRVGDDIVIVDLDDINGRPNGIFRRY